MVLAVIVISLVAFSGLALTYLFAEKEPFLWRVAAGNIIGASAFGFFGFAIANFFGLSVLTVTVALALTLLPLGLFAKTDYRERFRRDWEKAKGKLDGANWRKFTGFAYYVFFFLLFFFFFDRAMFETRAGIFTGGSQNLGDLPFHLGAIFSFTEGGNFPPENPSFAGARFSYPLIADFLTACLVKLGAGVKDAMLAQNVSWAFSLLVILERFIFKLTGSRLAGKIAPVLLFFSGGLGFLWFLKDYWQSAQTFFDFAWKLPRDYTIGENFRWGNALVTLFITQRSLLLGMPLTLIALQKLWEIFVAEKPKEKFNRDEEDERNKKQLSIIHYPLSIFAVGLLAGTLPLVHLHSLAVLFVVTAFLFIIRPEKWRAWIAFGAGVSIIAIPELLWSLAGSATHAGEFFAWHFGWDARDDNFFWFWLKNTGIFIPLVLGGIYLAQMRQDGKEKENETHQSTIADRRSLILFYLPFLFCFVVSNVAKLAPWEWDNIKVLIYWFVGSLPFVAVVLAFALNRSRILKIAAVAFLFVLTFSGALDVWRVASGQINYKVFDQDAVRIAEQIKQKTAPNALFLNAPTYNSAVVLSGRRSLMRYLGHLSSHGIDYAEREADLKRIYEGGATADLLLRKYDIEYVLISPEERALMPNEDYFQRFSSVAQSGQDKVYQVK